MASLPLLADGELLFERAWLAYVTNHPRRGWKQTNHTQRFYFEVSARLSPTSDTTLRPLPRVARVIHGWTALSWQPTGIGLGPCQWQPSPACSPPAVTTNLDISNETAIFRLRKTMHTTLLLWRGSRQNWVGWRIVDVRAWLSLHTYKQTEKSNESVQMGNIVFFLFLCCQTVLLMFGPIQEVQWVGW